MTDWYVQQWRDYELTLKEGWLVARDTNGYPPGTEDCDFDTFEEAVAKAAEEQWSKCIILVVEETHYVVSSGLDTKPLKKFVVSCYNAGLYPDFMELKSGVFFNTKTEAVLKAKAFKKSQRLVFRISDYIPL